MTYGSLFAGAGGVDLGFDAAGMSCKWQVEIDNYATKVLVRHWPGVKRFRDVYEVGVHNLEAVDLIAGGFPCTDISSANVVNAKGLDGDQSGLWYEFARIIKECQPRWVLVENSGKQWSRWVPSVRRDLWGFGYASLPLRMCPSSLGFPHRRDRVFVLAYANCHSKFLSTLNEKASALSPPPGALWDRGASPPGGFRVADGVANRSHRLRCIGNGVVPQLVEWIGRIIMEEENE